MSEKKRKKRKKEVSYFLLFPLLGRFTLQWILFSFSWLTNQYDTHDVEDTDNTRAIRWSDGAKEKIIFTNYIVN